MPNKQKMKATPHLVGPIEKCSIEQLIPGAQNARTHSPQQIAQIAASMVEFGFVNPILISPDHHIVVGHARLPLCMIAFSTSTFRF